VDEKYATALEALFLEDGFSVYHLDGSKMMSEEDFVRTLVTSLPCDPDYFNVGENRPPNWMAVYDSIWGGAPRGKDKMCIIWSNCDELVLNKLNLVLVNTKIMQRKAEAQKLKITAFLLGHCPSFCIGE
jgi:hypothetical protein